MGFAAGASYAHGGQEPTTIARTQAVYWQVPKTPDCLASTVRTAATVVVNFDGDMAYCTGMTSGASTTMPD